MPLARSRLLPEVFALSWKFVTYGFPPLTLPTTLIVWQRMKENKQAIESLAPRVKALAERLCGPVPEGGCQGARKEKETRTVLSTLYSPGTSVKSDMRGFAGSCKMFFEIYPRWKNKGKAEGFLNNAEDASKLDGLVEDIRDAIMEYRVRVPSYSFL